MIPYLKLSLTVLLVMCISHAFAQSFKPGYIIKNDSDTIQGYIKLTSQNKITTQCQFKSPNEEDIHTFTPNDIKAFRYTDSKYYVSLNYNQNQYFFECLIEGPDHTVFYASLDKNDQYFILTKEGKLVVLENTIGNTTNKAGYSKTAYRNEYKGVLSYIMSDAPEVTKEIARTPLTQKSLIKLSQDYHDITCGEGLCTVYKSESKNNYSFRISAGTYAQKTTIEDGNHDLNPRPEDQKVSDYHWNPTIGIGLDVGNFFGLSENINYHFEVSAHNNKLEFYDKDKLNYDFSSTEIRIIPFGFSYTYLAAKIKPYILVNAGVIYVFGQKFHNYTETPQDRFKEIADNNRRLLLGGGFGLRYALPKFDVFSQFNIEFPGSVEGIGGHWKSYTTAIGINAGIRLHLNK